MRNPYPGLRPFHRNESDIFFGREEQTDDLLRRLDRNHFLAVVGESGCGKSSLVRAGLIAALEAGFLPKAGSRWCTAVMRPGNRPIERLIDALEESDVGESEFDKDLKGLLRSTLNHGPKGLVNALKRLAMPDNVNFLLVVDQFEELFRITRGDNREQADAFVALLLNAAKQTDLSIYVVMTMRSDFLGDTALFNGLPETVNDGIYLTPRLSRAQRQSSIEGPASVFGGRVEPRVINRILNEMASDKVQLPLLQHLLMRMWQLAEHSTMSDESEDHDLTTSVGKVISEEQYESTGKLGKAVDEHADEIYNGLPPDQKTIARTIFECLCERKKDGGKLRNIRRPTKIDEIAEIANVDAEQVIAVANIFRASECNFIAPELAEEIHHDSTIDLSHESLMLAWDRLDGWMEEEAIHNEIFEDMLEDARDWERDKMESRLKAKQHLWDSKARSMRAQAWLRKDDASFEILQPDDFELVKKFARASVRQRQIKRWTVGAAASAVALVGMSFGVNYLVNAAGEASTYDFYKKLGGQIWNSDAQAKFIPILTAAGASLSSDFGCMGIVTAIEKENVELDSTELSDIDIDGLESEWESRMEDILSSDCSLDMKEIQFYSRPKGLVEIFATDRLGRNVCMSQKTSDYVQSDEDWWIDAVDSGGMSIGELEYDDSAGEFGVPIFLPVKNEKNETIGAAKAIFNPLNLADYVPLCSN